MRCTLHTLRLGELQAPRPAVSPVRVETWRLQPTLNARLHTSTPRPNVFNLSPVPLFPTHLLTDDHSLCDVAQGSRSTLWLRPNTVSSIDKLPLGHPNMPILTSRFLYIRVSPPPFYEGKANEALAFSTVSMFLHTLPLYILKSVIT